MVFNAAAEYKGTSLDEELLQGPQLNNSLGGVLFRFRKDEVAVTFDIESMFHRVGCAKEDIDALRFFWLSGSMQEPSNDYKMTMHFFGKADSSCIVAWALQKVVSGSFYADDGLFSVPTTEQAVEMSLKLIKLPQKGNFRLSKFVSNVREVLSAIPAEERTVKNLDLGKLPI